MSAGQSMAERSSLSTFCTAPPSEPWATLAVTNLHRVSAGVGVRDVLPGIDLDLMGGGMFESFEQLGDVTAGPEIAVSESGSDIPHGTGIVDFGATPPGVPVQDGKEYVLQGGVLAEMRP